MNKILVFSQLVIINGVILSKKMAGDILNCTGCYFIDKCYAFQAKGDDFKIHLCRLFWEKVPSPIELSSGNKPMYKVEYLRFNKPDKFAKFIYSSNMSDIHSNLSLFISSIIRYRYRIL